MGWRNCIVLMSGICLLADFVSAPASAQTRVGQAAVIKNQVHRVAGSAASQISVGDSVLRDEVVRTGVDSAARLVMADSTNLSLGPNATITLDRTVFNDEHSYREIAIRLATGAFRFVTGHSAKTAYKITTSLATIGVRGTILDILSQSVLGNGQGTQPTQGLPSKEVIVVLQEGAARVCTLGGQVRRANGAWPDRHHHLDGRQGHDSKNQHPALDLCLELRRSRGTLHRHEFCGCHASR
jgi:hypothetical protein